MYERPSPSPTEDIEASVEPEEPATQPLLTDVTQAEPVTALDKLEVKVTEPSPVSCQDTTKEALGKNTLNTNCKGYCTSKERSRQINY